MLGNKSFINGETLFEYGKFKILYSRSHNAYRVSYGDLLVPDHAGEGIEHLQYLIQKVAASEEAEQLITQGWKFIGTLPNGRVILQK